MVLNERWAGSLNTLFKTVFEDLARVCQLISRLGFNIFLKKYNLKLVSIVAESHYKKE